MITDGYETTSGDGDTSRSYVTSACSASVRMVQASNHLDTSATNDSYDVPAADSCSKCQSQDVENCQLKLNILKMEKELEKKQRWNSFALKG